MYEYKCQKCGHIFELIQRFSDAPLTAHEGCGGELEKLVSAPAFHLKGSGWYATDYAKGSGTNPAPKPGGDAAAKTDGNSDGKSDSKSDGKSDSKPDSSPAPAAAPPAATKESSTK
jgi:putative FmdB family regulatory protein